ncbi:hypothetical protein ElyMa_002208800 [Elysia marginata]|uniref:Uncharacterized protein n=1 Tax=Elysia marginata TaxID=1093978 RepID=A0AAV4FVB0_9GAST|nr:hypothetical protein ElyMa_002208800 [Elysia marginata]
MSNSTSLASFLSRLLKPDRKENVPTSNKSKVLKRHSAPVPNNFDVTNPAHIPPPSAKNSQAKARRKQIGGTIEEIQNTKSKVNKTSREDKRQKNTSPKENTQKVTLRKAQEGADKENERRSKSSNTRKTTRRHSTGLAYWFCVSGNADTLERGLKKPFPQENKNEKELNDREKRNKKQELAIIPEQGQLKDKGGTSGVPKPISLAGVIRRDGKKKRGDTKNRHSAPPDTLAVFRPKDRPQTANHHGDITHPVEITRRRRPDRTEVVPSPTRSMSPGVRYRVDGTLERPYVFPSALTFGAEGRKTQLRSSDVSPVQEFDTCPRSNLSTSMVLAEVHSPVCETAHHEKRVGSNSNVADISYDDFDVRKAFYLKYDDCDPEQMQPPAPDTRLCRHSMPMFPADFDVLTAHHSSRNGIPQGLPPSDMDGIHRSDPVPMRQRYSMPPKNEEFVYMGSKENLSVWTEFVDRQEVMKNSAMSHCETESAPRKRYSSPVQNRDYVYMGSIENIHLLNVEDKRAGCMSLKRDVDALFLSEDGADSAMANQDPGIASSSASVDDNQETSNLVRHPTSCQDDESLNKDHQAMDKQKRQFEEHHQSLPELCLHTDKRLSRAVHSESSAIDDDVVHSDGINMNKDNIRGAFCRNPFARNLGRSSCMPGNKKSFVPPPAIFSHPQSNVGISNTNKTPEMNVSALGKFSIMPGNKQFKLPPPPDYTPPREEMERAQTKLAECHHKGSQTDLQDEALYCVNMEDRDLSLTRDQAKTIHSLTLTSEFHTLIPVTNSDINDYYSTAANESSPSNVGEEKQQKTQTNVQRLLNVSMLSQGSDDVFKDGSASDTMGPVDNFQPSKRGTYLLPGVRAKSVSVVHKDLPSRIGADCEKSKDLSILSKSDDKVRKDEHTDSPAVSNETACEYSPSKSTEIAENKKTLGHNETMEMIGACATSTPKIARRDKSDKKLEEATTIPDRPVPTPRKRYSGIDLFTNVSNSPRSISLPSENYLQTKEKSSPLQPKHGSCEVSEDHQPSPPTVTKSPPVPKKRRNISKSRTDSESCFSAPETSEKVQPHQTYVQSNTKTDNIIRPEIPFEKENLPDSLVAGTKNTPPVQAQDINTPGSKNPQSFRLRDEFHKKSAVNKRFGKGLSLDDTCIADDELSCYDDMDMEEARDSTLKRRRRSMRKCVSVDDLLRSGSILDRSMILARKRRRRMRDRKCQSQVQLSSSEAEDAADGLVTSSRRKARSRDALCGRKEKGTHRAAPTQPGATSSARPICDNRPKARGSLGTFDGGLTPTAQGKHSKGVNNNTKMSSLGLAVRNIEKNNTGTIDSVRPSFSWTQQCRGTVVGELGRQDIEDPLETSNVCSPSSVTPKPWEVGLLNVGQNNGLFSTSDPVPRWRKGISASTPSLAIEKPIQPGRETVV